MPPFSKVPTPFLSIDLRRVRSNIARVLELTGGPDRWRPHLKTTKTPEVWSELLVVGIRSFKCATVLEAEVLCMLLERRGIHGVDLLLAYPLLGPGLERLAQLAREHGATRISILVEDPESARTLPEPLTAFIDIDPGMHRTGLDPGNHESIGRTATALGERLRGIHFYEGHLHTPDLEERESAVHACLDELFGLHTFLRDSGHAVEELVTSGTPAFRAALTHPGLSELGTTLHRVSPGTVVFHDALSELENPDFGLEPAACVHARVISHPSPGIVTLDAGSKSVSTDAGDPCASIPGHPELEALTPSEEHLPVRVMEGPPPARGTLLTLVPRHVCPTVNLYSEALLLDGNELRWIPIAARGHR